MRWRLAKRLAAAGAGLGLGVVPLWAEVYYEVGAGQTYATIQAALVATPWNFSSQPQPTFTQSHIINIHAGTYVNFETDLNSRLNGQLSRTSVTNRLIIQAVPGDEVVINSPTNSQIRESHVTVRGLKFTGKSADPNWYYIWIGTGGYATPNRQRGGIIVQNCEFVGGRGLKRADSAFYNGLEPGVAFSHAFVNNYVHHFESHYEVNGYCEKAMFHGGNLYAQWGTLGGASIFRPSTNGFDETRWYLNNTFYTTNGNLTGAVRTGSTNAANVVFANNILYWNGLSNQWYEYCDVKPNAGYWPTLAHNLRYAARPIHWGRSVGVTYATLTAWSNYVAASGGTLVGHLESNPYFVNAAAGDFRLDAIAQRNDAVNRADRSYWDAAMAAMGLSADHLDYWNPARDVGFYHQGAPPHLGAMEALTPPAGTAISVR